jgi:hypothetical protein
MPNVPCPTHNPVHFVRTAREMVERIHAYDSKAFLQLSGGFGRVTIPTNLGEYPPVAPSPIPHRWLDKTCRPLTKEEIHSLVKKFGDGAFHARRAGFDGIQIHAVAFNAPLCHASSWSMCSYHRNRASSQSPGKIFQHTVGSSVRHKENFQPPLVLR